MSEEEVKEEEQCPLCKILEVQKGHLEQQLEGMKSLKNNYRDVAKHLSMAAAKILAPEEFLE